MSFSPKMPLLKYFIESIEIPIFLKLSMEYYVLFSKVDIRTKPIKNPIIS